MIPREILDKVQLIEIQTGRLVTNLFAGEYHSVFKGHDSSPRPRGQKSGKNEV